LASSKGFYLDLGGQHARLFIVEQREERYLLEYFRVAGHRSPSQVEVPPF